MKTLCLFLMLVGARAVAFGCDINVTDYPYTPPGGTQMTRQYYEYPSANLGAHPTLWVMLHGTVQNDGTTPPCPFDETAMKTLANNNNIVVIWPISTYVSAHGSWFWDALDLCYIWATGCTSTTGTDPVDDSGFIAALTGSRKSYYSSNTVYVTGISSGAFMAQRMGFDHPWLVTAVGAASGQIWAAAHGTTPNLPTAPTSPKVLMLNGDIDPTVVYCGQLGHGWGGSDFPPSDVSLDYWATATRGCSQQLPQLCNSDGTVNTSVTNFTCGKTTFVREVNNPHCWVPGTESRMWTFFNGGGWTTTSLACLNIISFTPTQGSVGTTVTITGGGFTGTTSVKFNGTSATTFTVISDTQVTAKVPTGASTGKIAITTPSGGTATSTLDFMVQ